MHAHCKSSRTLNHTGRECLWLGSSNPKENGWPERVCRAGCRQPHPRHATRPEALPPGAKSESVPTWSSCWGILGASVAAVSRRVCIRSTWLDARSGTNTSRGVAIPEPNLDTLESEARLQDCAGFCCRRIHSTRGLQFPTARISTIRSAIPQLSCQPMSMTASRSTLPVICVGSMASAAAFRRQRLAMAV